MRKNDMSRNVKSPAAKKLLYSSLLLGSVLLIGGGAYLAQANDDADAQTVQVKAATGQATTSSNPALVNLGSSLRAGSVTIQSVTKADKYFEVTYSNGQKARLFVLTDKMFRFYLDPTGKYGDPEQSDKGLKARILATTQGWDAYKQAAFDATTLAENGNEFTLKTGKLTIAFDKAAGTMSVKKGERVVLQETQPIQIAGGKTTQYLADHNNNYFGGGTQNGRFMLTGSDTKIVNTNNWVDQGVASPNPFYWSTAGYGVVRNTFKPGLYQFGTDKPGTVATTHDEERFDAVYFFDDTGYELIHDYQELTGLPAMMPRFGFYEAHLNAYNRDYWKQVSADTAGAVKFEDGKYYKEYQPSALPDKTGAIRETLNGEGASYQFSARGVIDRYAANDMPLGWFLPNDGYGAGYGQTSTLDGNIQNLKSFTDYANSKGIETGLWTQQNLSPVDPAHPKPDDRDFAREVKEAGVRALKTDVAWVGSGYSFGLNGTQTAADAIQKEMGDSVRPMIVSLDGWAGTQRTAGVWSGDQTGGKWEYIRFHIPTYIGTGLSGQPNVGSDMDGIFGGKNPIINARDYQWKAFTPIQLNMDGWGSNPKAPYAMDKKTSDLNRAYLKQKTEMMPYVYNAAHQSTFEGKPMVRAMFLEYDVPEAYSNLSKYQYMWGDNFLVAPIYQDTASDADGNDIRNGIFLPDKKQVWVDYYTGKEYQGGQVLNNFEAPLWKLPLFVKKGAITAKTTAHNTPGQYDQTKRTYEVFPAEGTSTTNVYEDDGKSAKYLKGENATTNITSVLNKGDLTITAGKLTGSFAGMNATRTTEFAAHTNKAPETVEATVGGHAVTLTKVNSLEEYKAGTNVYFFDENYATNEYLQKIDEAKDAVSQSFLRAKVGDTDVSANEVVLHATGIDASDQAEGAGEINNSLTAPTGLTQDKSKTSPTQLGIKWDAYAGATSYNILFDGQNQTGFKTTDAVFAELDYNSPHKFKIQAVTPDGLTPWSEEQTFSTDEDPLKNSVKVQATMTQSPIKGVPMWQDSQPLKYLFDRDLTTTAHTNWFTSTPKQSATPIAITAKLERITELDHVVYVPRTDAGNGTAKAMNVMASLDGIHWKKVGGFSNTNYSGEQQTIEIEKGTKAYYLRFEVPAKSTVGDFFSGSEILVFENPKGRGTIPGDITSDGVVDENDETSLREYTGDTIGIDNDFEGYAQTGDLNGNGTIDAFDINYVMKQLGENPVKDADADKTVPTGTLSLSADKTVYEPGDTVTVTVKGHDLSGVNALSARLRFDSYEMALKSEGIAAGDMTKDMVSFSKVRKHTNGDEDAYIVYANRGNAPRLSGDGDIATLKFTALTPLNGKDIVLQLSDSMLVNQASLEAQPANPDALVLKANLLNTTGLKQSLDVANKINRDLYTTETSNALKKAIEEGEAALKNTDLTQAEVDAIQQKVVTAVEKLVPLPHSNTEALKELIATFKKLNKDNYRPAAYDAAKKVMDDAAKKLETDLNATDAAALTKQAGDALIALLNDGLKPDTTTLANVIKSAKALKADDYTTDSYKAVTDALKEAEKVAANTNATKTEVNNASAKLVDAIAKLVAKPVKTVDNSQLAAAVNKYAGYKEDDYTTDSFKGFADSLSHAKSVLENKDATQAEVDKALTELNAAASALKKPDKKVDKTELQKLVDDAKKLKKEDYTKESYDKLTKALEDAQNVLDNKAAEQSDVASVSSDLDKAISGLIKKDPEDNKGDNGGNDKGENGGNDKGDNGQVDGNDKDNNDTNLPGTSGGNKVPGDSSLPGANDTNGTMQGNTDSKVLPQTGEQRNTALTIIGAAMLSILGFLGFRKKRDSSEN